VLWLLRILAHSLRLALPRISAPASRRRCTRKASRAGRVSAIASEPAVVSMRSWVSMLSFSRIGRPCSGLRGPWRRRSSSSALAIAIASGSSCSTLEMRGPARSMRAMRSV
jgi:hypothetical protein